MKRMKTPHVRKIQFHFKPQSIHPAVFALCDEKLTLIVYNMVGFCQDPEN